MTEEQKTILDKIDIHRRKGKSRMDDMYLSQLKELEGRYQKLLLFVKSISKRFSLFETEKDSVYFYVAKEYEASNLLEEIGELEEALKPCPFCYGSPCMIGYSQGDKHDDVYLIECQECFSQSSSCDSENSAKKLWNTRASE